MNDALKATGLALLLGVPLGLAYVVVLCGGPLLEAWLGGGG